MTHESYDQRYLRKTEVASRYDMTPKSLDRLLHHMDPDQRFPPPALFMARTPYWLVTDLDRFDAEQIERSKGRDIRHLGESYRSVKGQAKRGAR